MELKNSETLQNLMRAFAGESQARNRYTFAAGLARRKNLYVLESVFTFTADQERAHAKVFYNLLEQVSGQNLQVQPHAGDHRRQRPDRRRIPGGPDP